MLNVTGGYVWIRYVATRLDVKGSMTFPSAFRKNAPMSERHLWFGASTVSGAHTDTSR